MKFNFTSVIHSQQQFTTLSCSFTTAIQLLCIDGTLQQNFVTILDLLTSLNNKNLDVSCHR